MKIIELLDKAKERANLESDYALSKAVGISAGNMSNIRKGRAHPSNELAVQLATLAGLDDMQVIAEIEYQTAKTTQKKKFWKHYLEQRSLAGCLAMTAITAAILISPEQAKAEETTILQMQNYDAINEVNRDSFYTLCEHFKYRDETIDQ